LCINLRLRLRRDGGDCLNRHARGVTRKMRLDKGKLADDGRRLDSQSESESKAIKDHERGARRQSEDGGCARIVSGADKG
jgi:hypothetical protein